MAQVFISYSHVDRKEAELVHASLNRAGYDVAIDREIPAGASWRTWLTERISHASVVVVLWSKTSVAGNWVRAEADLASRTSTLLPLIVDDLGEESIPLGFGECQFLRCRWEFDPQTGERRLSEETTKQLSEALGLHLGTVTPLNEAIDQLRQALTEAVAGQYSDLEMVGTGRMSVVFKARHKKLDGAVALQVTPLAGIMLLPHHLDRFRRGIELAQQLKHPNILDVREARLEGTIAWTTLQYVDGVSLDKHIEQGPMALSRIRSIALGVAEGLAFAHARDVVHCNLSPFRVLLDREDQAYITDFGLAHVSRATSATKPHSSLTTEPAYMSPEQCLGQGATPRSDQYALGVILYEMLTGHPPFVADSPYLVMRQHCELTPPPIQRPGARCPQVVASTVKKLLSKDPLERYLTTRELIEEIATWPAYDTMGTAALSQTWEAVLKTVRVAKRSLDRCTKHNPNFYLEFYRQALREPSLQKHLGAVNFDRQVNALSRGVTVLLDYGYNPTKAASALERMATPHRSLGLAWEHFQLFGQVLTTVALNTDPDAAESAEKREALRQAFAQALQPGLERLFELSSVDAPGSNPEAPMSSDVRPTPEGQRRQIT